MRKISVVLVFVLALLGLLALSADEPAEATFGASPGSIQLRNPAWLRTYTAQTLQAVGGVVNVDWRQGPWFQITLTGNVTFAAPLNVGENCIQIVIIQDGTGSRTGSWTNTSGGSGWKFSGGTATTLSTAAFASDIATACPFKSGSANEAAINVGTNYK